jgi:UDP-N-acetylmuramyl tripeptide synthase
MKQIEKGFKKGIRQRADAKSKYALIEDRTKAIHYAIAGAGAGDIVIIAGKGAEDSVEIRGKKYPYSDAAVVAEYVGVTGDEAPAGTSLGEDVQGAAAAI